MPPPALSSLDFQQARVKQVLFKSRLRSVLYGVREAEPSLFSPTDSPLGQWLSTTLKPAYGPRPEITSLEHLLRQTLDQGQQLVRLYQRGDIEQARRGLEQIEALATQFDTVLTGLEKAG